MAQGRPELRSASVGYVRIESVRRCAASHADEDEQLLPEARDSGRDGWPYADAQRLTNGRAQADNGANPDNFGTSKRTDGGARCVPRAPLHPCD